MPEQLQSLRSVALGLTRPSNLCCQAGGVLYLHLLTALPLSQPAARQAFGIMPGFVFVAVITADAVQLPPVLPWTAGLHAVP